VTAGEGEPIQALLEELRAAYISRGVDVDRHLLPGVDSQQITDRTSGLGFAVPDEIVALYSWRDGQGDGAEYDTESFSFRDEAFIGIERALVERDVLLETYGDLGPDVVPLGFDLDRTFPFATYEGAYYVIVCGPHQLASPFPHPIVSVFEGIDMFFHSFELMVRTCIDWARHPSWTKSVGLPDDVEGDIWRRNNPGIFE
jgi:hypothetical protein